MLFLLNICLCYLFVPLYKKYQKLNKRDYFLLIIVYIVNLFLKRNFILILTNYILLLVIINDIHEMWIPDLVHILIGMINIFKVSVSYFLFNQQIIYSGLIAALILMMMIKLLEIVLKKDLMGFGDLKLLFVLSIGIDFYHFYFLLFLSSIFGIIFYYLFFKKEKIFPFGPFIVIGYLIIHII